MDRTNPPASSTRHGYAAARHGIPVWALVALSCFFAKPSFGEEWREVTARDGVQVSVRKVSKSAIDEVRGVAIFNLPAEKIFAVLADIESYPGSIPTTTVARLLRREGNTAWYYMVIDPPWISRRDYCMRVSFTRLPNKELRSDWEIDSAGCLPPHQGMVRMERNSGFWLLTPIDNGAATKVVYQAHSDPGGAVPKWIANRAWSRKLPDIFVSVRRAAASPR